MCVDLGLAIFMTFLVGFVDAPLDEADLGRVLTHFVMTWTRCFTACLCLIWISALFRDCSPHDDPKIRVSF